MNLRSRSGLEGDLYLPVSTQDKIHLNQKIHRNYASCFPVLVLYYDLFGSVVLILARMTFGKTYCSLKATVNYSILCSTKHFEICWNLIPRYIYLIIEHLLWHYNFKSSTCLFFFIFKNWRHTFDIELHAANHLKYTK